MPHPATATPIRRVHLIFKTHLDVGFTDFARNVVARYFDVYIPAALALARELREAGAAERFVWTTGSWLIYEYLEQARGEARARMEEAILAGDIAWHGLPFTMHSELLDPGLFRFGLTLAQELDQRFGRHTIAAKMTDVPGHTRGIVPLLAEAGIRFLHLGVNAASRPPAVPDVFRWRDPSGAEVIVMVHKGAYGGLKRIPGLGEAILFAHTNDNAGPQSATEVRAAFRQARRRVPGAEVVASTMDAFAARLLTIKGQLPVLEGEIGDTWIHGVGSDPRKVAQLRALLRLRQRWLAEGRVDPESAAFKAFSHALLLVPEHTWGQDIKLHLSDFTCYDKERFRAACQTPRFQSFASSWEEQRAYIRSAVESLSATPLARDAEIALQALEPTHPDLSGLAPADPAAVFETDHWLLGFDPQTGALNRLQDRASGRLWASPGHELALLRYQTFSQADYDRFYERYIVHKRRVGAWAVPDFTKPGIDACGAVHGEWLPRLTHLYHHHGAAGHRFVALMRMPEGPVGLYGCPAEVTLEVELPRGEPALFLTLQWFGKQACRLPEALWLSFSPRVHNAGGWQMDKLGQAVSPLEVVRDGNRRLHAVGSGVSYRDAQGSLAIETLDAPLVAPGWPSLLTHTNRQPPLRRGMHFLLFNNVWGTNFRMWYGEDARFRFLLSAGSQAAGLPEWLQRS